MRLRGTVTLIVAAAMAASSLSTPVLAAPAPVASAPAPQAESVDGAEMRHGTLIPLIAILVGGIAIFFAARKHHHNGNSP